MRPLVFISHANPEDNDFVVWLGTQLTRLGFQVWSDVTKLFGGESFWQDIEDAIRTHTAKFVLVVSHRSNDKPGVLRELSVADSVAKDEHLKDFIIPLRVDDLPFSKRNILIHPLNTIDFHENWSTGLATLAKKLTKDGVPVDRSEFNSAAVRKWWENREGERSMLSKQVVRHVTNWFPFLQLPDGLWAHRFSDRKLRKLVVSSFEYPVASKWQYLLTACAARELSHEPEESVWVDLKTPWEERLPDLRITETQQNDVVLFLMRDAWERKLSESVLNRYELSGRLPAFFFPKVADVPRQQAYMLSDGTKGRRALYGKYKKAIWHYGLSASAQLLPVPSMVIRSHVVFSDDGATAWSSSDRQHSARRSCCKMWWNDRWRDMLLSSMAWLAEKERSDGISLPLSSEAAFLLSAEPLSVQVPTDYDESKAVDDNWDEDHGEETDQID